MEQLLDKCSGWSKLSEISDLPLELIDMYPDKPWNWSLLSQNKNLNTEFIEKYATKRWNWSFISHDDSDKYNTPIIFDMNFILRLKEKGALFSTLDLEYISDNPGITIFDIAKYFDNKKNEIGLFPPDCINLAFMSKDVTMEFVDKFFDDDEYYYAPDLAYNKYISKEIVVKYFEHIKKENTFERCVRFTPDLIEMFKDSINWNNLSCNPNLSMECIEKYKDFLDMELVRKYNHFFKLPPDMTYIYDSVIHNYHMTIDLLKRKTDSSYYFNLYVNDCCDNPNINPQDIIDQGAKLTAEKIKCNVNLTKEFVDKYKDKYTWLKWSPRRDAWNKSYYVYKKYKRANHLPVVQRYETKIRNTFDLLCDDLIGIVINFL
jgi:hypothetical protein